MNQLRLLSFNIGGCSQSSDYRKGWNYRQSACIKILQEANADLLGFQEVQSGNKFTLDSFLINYDSYYGYKSGSKKIGEFYYNPIFWRKDVFIRLGKGAFYLSKTPKVWSRDWDAKDVRSATWVKLIHLKSRSTLIYLNLHLDHKGVLSRIESSNLVINRLKDLQKEASCLVFISGDFNERAWHPKNEIVQNYPPPILSEYIPVGNSAYRKFIESGYKDAYLEAGNFNKLGMNTYHDYLGLNFPPAAMRIDWILFAGQKDECKVNKFRIINSPPDCASDHFPIMAEFYF